MAPFAEEVGAMSAQEELQYSILHQRVDLDINFAGRSLKGSTEITVQPLTAQLSQILLHCRQCRPTAIQVGGITAKWQHADPYRRSHLSAQSTVYEHDMLKSRVESSLRPKPEPELKILLPSKLRIHELQVDPTTALPQYSSAPSLGKQEMDTMASMETSVVTTSLQPGPQFAPIKLSIEFEITNFRDGIHWIGHTEGDMRYQCMYTKVDPLPGNTSCIIPCVDDAITRCSWEISIRAPRTLGDAFRNTKVTEDDAAGHEPPFSNGIRDMSNGVAQGHEMDRDTVSSSSKEYLIDLSEEDASLDLAVICVGAATDDVVDPEDETKKTVTFNLTQPVTARHVGFAVGAFERIDLLANRDGEDEDKLGQSALALDGYCLPGKRTELQNTCLPMPWAMDSMSIKYGSFPFNNYQMLFVDDFVYDTVATAGLSFCSTSLLFPRNIIEPLYRNTRLLVRTLADQWMGVNIVAQEALDEWVVAGIAGFMTDLYMKELSGNNEFRWQQKLAAEKVYELDADRPSIRALGELLHIDHTIRDFVNLKSALVLFILDRRLMKTTGQTGVHRIINKIFLNAKTGALTNGELSTADFQRTCEKLGHNKLESFFKQWVFNSGCPIFYVTQRFNKKKLCVEMKIMQRQLDRTSKPPFEPKSFMREIKEHVQEVWAPEVNPLFTGPMTIRIHEADGTPYEHIVEIKEAITQLDIPYNTKYKRLKRSRRQKERQMAEGTTGEGGDDALLYCLGDILDSEQDKQEWNLKDWTEEDEQKMGQESYEWIRMDADFEWIGKIHLVMPLYMYISQLQQDRDIVAQYESMRYLLGSNPHHVSLSILVRTLMDSRYFWGIREMAAEGLALSTVKTELSQVAAFHLTKAFRELFCIGNTNMPKPNDFEDRRDFVIQCAIPRAMSQLRGTDDKVPMAIRQLFVDLLKFNDNSSNHIDDADFDNITYSDNHYIVTLMRCLSEALVASHREYRPSYTYTFGMTDEPMDEPEETEDDRFEKVAIAQFERHRRVDEWNPSYQNIYSVTALACLQRLTKAGIVKDKTSTLMQYVRAGIADNVRIAAWRCLSEVGVMRRTAAMRYMLKCLADDPSPWFRDGLLRIFGEALGHIAFGDPEPIKAAPQPATDTDLILEQEASSETRHLEQVRRVTAPGAMAALKASLEPEEVFKQSLWYAATSPYITIDEIAALCDIAALIYEPREALMLSLKMPRMWRCENLGQGRVKFVPGGPHRQSPSKGLSLVDWQNLQKLGLVYNGPLAADILKHQASEQTEKSAATLKLKIAQTAQQIQQAQSDQVANEMPPPSVLPSTEKTGFKLNLGAKRKQSIDLGPPSKAASPKVAKLSKQSTPSGTIQTQALRKSSSPPAASQRKSSTPGSRPHKMKSSRMVVLHLGRHAEKARQYISAPPRPRATNGFQTQATTKGSTSPAPIFPHTSALSPAYVQSLGNTVDGLSGTASATSPIPVGNFGAFRSYGPPPDVEVPPAPLMKQESSASSADEPLINGTSAARTGADEAIAAPPPNRKFTLKLGARKSSDHSSPT